MTKLFLIILLSLPFLFGCFATNTVANNVTVVTQPRELSAQDESHITSESSFDLSKIPDPSPNERMIGTYERIDDDGAIVTRDFLTGWGEKCPVQYHADKGQNMDEERKGPYSITDCVIWEERVVLGGQP